MKSLSICLEASTKEEDLVFCLKEAIQQMTVDSRLSSEKFEDIIGLLLESLRAGSFDGVTLFTELWNTYEKDLHLIASYLIPIFMGYLNTEQEMVLFAALNTASDKEVINQMACKISEAYNPTLDQWSIFLNKLAVSENENICNIHDIVKSLLIVAEKIEKPRQTNPASKLFDIEEGKNKSTLKNLFKSKSNKSPV